MVADVCPLHSLLHDVEYFRNRLAKLQGAGDVGDYIVDIVRKKMDASPLKGAVAVQTSAPEKQAEPENGALDAASDQAKA